ncbi:integrase, catalytic region, zinc finger, CCHC-type containing protein [Tanacetum coccineum]
MSTSKTYQQSLADASSETRPPMLERGSYIPWASRFRRYINRKRENRKWLNKALDEGPYQFEMFIPKNSTVPKLQTAEDLQGDALLHYDAEMKLMNLILISIPNDIYNSVDAFTSAKDMWKRVERLMRGTIQKKVDRETRFTNEFDQFVDEPGEALVSVYNRFAQLMNDLERNDMHFPIQFEKLVNVLRAKKLKKSHDPLALVAHTGSSSRNTSSYYVTHPTSVVDYEDEYQQDDVHTNSEDPLASAMLLLARAITQNFSTPTNNRLRTSFNTRSQEIIQGDRVNIQSMNSGLFEPRLQETLQLFNATTVVEKEIMLGIVQSQEMKEIEELSANICLMARIQPADNTSDAGLSYDSAFINIIRDLEKQRDKLDLDVKDYKRQNEELQKTHSILKRQMSENEDKYHDTVLDLEAKLKKNVDLILKLGNSLQGMFMLGPKPLSVYDQQLKHGLGYPNPYTLKQAISQCPKLYLASSLGNSEISLNVRDTEDTLDDASKSQQKVYEKMNDPIAVANKQNCWTIDYAQINALYKDFVPQKELSAEQKYFPSSFIPSDKNSNATPSIPASMPSESPLIIELDKIKNGFQKLSELIQKNCKRASIFYTSPEEIQLNDFCQDQLKPIVNELQFYFEFFKTLFQRDIKEMKDVFEYTESELCELEKQNDFLKDQLLEVSLKHEVELSVLLNHECVDNSLHVEVEQIKKKSIKIQEGLQARIKILEKDVQRCEKQSVDFELKLQHEKEKHKWDSNLKNKNTNPLDYSWISKMEKLEDENVSLDFTVQSLIKEHDNLKLEYQKLFNSIKKTRSQTQKEMDELIAHVSEKTYMVLFVLRMNAASSVRRPMNRDSHVKNSVLANSKKPAKKVAVYVRKNKQTDNTSENVIRIILWIVDSGCSKHMTGDRSLLKNFIKKFIGTTRFRNDNFAAITGYGDYIQGNITIYHVYYVEGLGHNLFSVGQFCDGDLEVAFRSKTCYVRNLEGDDLLTGGRESNLYTISISDMASSSPVYLMSKATSTKSWLWHHRLSHLNFGTINDLTRLDLVNGLLKFKYGKDHLCSTCERGKSKKASHPLKLVLSDHFKLELLHMDLCGPMRVASINGKKYILVIVDDYS